MHRGQTAQRVDEHGEEAERGSDHDLRPRAEGAEPGVRDRRERDHRDRVRSDQVRDQRVAERAPTGEHERREDGDAAPEQEPAERLLEGDPGGGLQRVTVLPEGAEDIREPGQEERLHAEDVGEDPLPAEQPDPEDECRREPRARESGRTRRRRRPTSLQRRCSRRRLRVGLGLDGVEQSRAPR